MTLRFGTCADCGDGFLQADGRADNLCFEHRPDPRVVVCGGCGEEFACAGYGRKPKFCPTCTPARRDRSSKYTRWKGRLKSKYGLSPEAWHALLIAQVGRCGICATPMQAPKVDHCHDTGRVRGMLCHGCNTALGKLGDNVAGLRRALEYLTKEAT